MTIENHMAIVTDNEDLEFRGRLKVRCQTLVGADYQLPDWVDPASPVFTTKKGGGFFIPEVGATVEITVTVSDSMDDMPNERFLSNPAIKWHMVPPTAGDGSPMPVPALLRTNYPNRRGFVTPSGHAVILDDESRDLIIIGSGGGTVTFQANGTITMTSPVKLGVGSTELMILGNLFMALYNSHIHPTGVGPSGTPVVQMTTAQLSQQGNTVA